jgi:hypothetical protein
MANQRGKSVDTTYLSIDNAEERGFLHRDYIAHCLRWSHVMRELGRSQSYKTARILDIGCGREAPLAKMLYSSRMAPALYVGVDYGPIPDETCLMFKGEFQPEFWERQDFAILDPGHFGDGRIATPFTHVVCFEMLEHIEPEHVLRTLRHLKMFCDPNTRIFISTPCWDVVSCAANHVNEMRYDTLGAVFEREGFTIVDVHGTFASIRDYEHKLSPAHRETFEDLRAYYDTNFLACILAPFYPAQSRNCLWELKACPFNIKIRKFPNLEDVAKPWSSSANWEDFIRV